MKELIEKETECKRLTGLREQMNSELEDLTASLFEVLVRLKMKTWKYVFYCNVAIEVLRTTWLLFQEANKMIQDAHVKRIQAEKKLTEAENKVCY